MFTKCTVVNSRGTKALQYQNERTGRKLPITVGPLGGISIKPPNRTRRYVGCCKKTQCSKNFQNTRKAIVKARKEGRKRAAPTTKKRRRRR